MFTFRHPRPVGNRKPVAELSMRQEARASDASRAVLVGKSDVLSAPTAVAASSVPQQLALEFSVSYRLAEYLSFARDHAPLVTRRVLAAKGKPVQTPSRLQGVTLTLVCSVAFFFKKRRMPICRFIITGDGIHRSAASRNLFVPWTEVLAVHRYSQGYLIEMHHGAIPLPFRCLCAQQLPALDALIAKWQGASLASTY